MEAEGLWTGPIKPEEWISAVIDDPKDENRDKGCDIDFSKASSSEKSFAEAVKSSKMFDDVQGLFPRDTHTMFGVDSSSGRVLRPDFSVLSEDFSFEHGDQNRIHRIASCTELFVDLKSKDADDPCNYIAEEKGTRTDTEGSIQSRGQFLTYAQMVFDNSFRTHSFALVVTPNYARFMRFDRSGVLFSHRFDWRKGTYISDFLWRFTRGTEAQRGRDPTVSTASEELGQYARKIAEGSKDLPLGLSVEDVIPQRKKLSVVNVYDEAEKRWHKLVTYKAMSYTSALVGRATRGFLAVDLDLEKVVFMKDSWRIDLEDFPKESKTYEQLKEAEVPHLAGFLYGGDVPTSFSPDSKADVTEFQRTLTWSFAEEHNLPRGNSDKLPGSDSLIELTPYTHTRLVFSKIGRPLHTFTSTKELCTALRHALEAHHIAATKARILHRDISGGNILIDKDGNGILIDWDACAALDGDKQKSSARRKGRTGTWRFISARLLMNEEDCVHSVRDDIESIVHVLFYYVLRYRPTWTRTGTLESDIAQVFDYSYKTEAGKLTGGKTKKAYLDGGVYFKPSQLEEHITPLGLLKLMAALRDLFKPIYASEPDSPSILAPETEQEDYEQQVSKWESNMRLGKKKLENGIEALRAFRIVLDSPGFQWPSDDGAVGQFPGFEIHRPTHMPSRTTHLKRTRSEYENGAGNLPHAEVPRVLETQPEAHGAQAEGAGMD